MLDIPMANAHLIMQIDHSLNHLMEDPLGSGFEVALGVGLGPYLLAFIYSHFVNPLISFEVLPVSARLYLAKCCEFHHQVHLLNVFIVK